jgi:transcriptional regulator with XRE-family HTH domain
MQFAETIRSGLDARKWSVKRFADEIGRSPEHARKLSSGTAFPSDDLAVCIAQKLELDQTEFQKQLEADRWQKKYRKKPPESEHPDLGALEHLWVELTAEQRECIVCLADCLLSRRRSHM